MLADTTRVWGRRHRCMRLPGTGPAFARCTGTIAVKALHGWYDSHDCRCGKDHDGRREHLSVHGVAREPVVGSAELEKRVGLAGHGAIAAPSAPRNVRFWQGSAGSITGPLQPHARASVEWR